MDGINIIQIIFNYFIPLILGGAIGIISTKLKKDKKKDKAIEEGVQALLRNELVTKRRTIYIGQRKYRSNVCTI